MKKLIVATILMGLLFEFSPELIADPSTGRPIEFSEPRNGTEAGQDVNRIAERRTRLSKLEERLAKTFNFFDAQTSLDASPPLRTTSRIVTVKGSDSVFDLSELATKVKEREGGADDDGDSQTTDHRSQQWRRSSESGSAASMSSQTWDIGGGVSPSHRSYNEVEDPYAFLWHTPTDRTARSTTASSSALGMGLSGLNQIFQRPSTPAGSPTPSRLTAPERGLSDSGFSQRFEGRETLRFQGLYSGSAPSRQIESMSAGFSAMPTEPIAPVAVGSGFDSYGIRSGGFAGGAFDNSSSIPIAPTAPTSPTAPGVEPQEIESQGFPDSAYRSTFKSRVFDRYRY